MRIYADAYMSKQAHVNKICNSRQRRHFHMLTHDCTQRACAWRWLLTNHEATDCKGHWNTSWVSVRMYACMYIRSELAITSPIMRPPMHTIRMYVSLAGIAQKYWNTWLVLVRMCICMYVCVWRRWKNQTLLYIYTICIYIYIYIHTYMNFICVSKVCIHKSYPFT